MDKIIWKIIKILIKNRLKDKMVSIYDNKRENLLLYPWMDKDNYIGIAFIQKNKVKFVDDIKIYKVV